MVMVQKREYVAVENWLITIDRIQYRAENIVNLRFCHNNNFLVNLTKKIVFSNKKYSNINYIIVEKN